MQLVLWLVGSARATPLLVPVPPAEPPPPPAPPAEAPPAPEAPSAHPPPPPAPPLELIGHEPTPRAEGACELQVFDHDAEEGLPFAFRLVLSAPDRKGRSWVQRVTQLPPDTWKGVPAASPIAPAHELDVHQRFEDQRLATADGAHHATLVRPRSVDWSRWPLTLEFIGPRVDDPRAIGAYQVTTRPGATREAWGGCVLTVSGPGVSGCVQVEEPAPGCLAAYVDRHRLGER